MNNNNNVTNNGSVLLNRNKNGQNARTVMSARGEIINLDMLRIRNKTMGERLGFRLVDGVSQRMEEPINVTRLPDADEEENI